MSTFSIGLQFLIQRTNTSAIHQNVTCNPLRLICLLFVVDGCNSLSPSSGHLPYGLTLIHPLNCYRIEGIHIEVWLQLRCLDFKKYERYIHPRFSQPSHSSYSVNFSGQMHIFLIPVIQFPVWPCLIPAKLLSNGKEFILTSGYNYDALIRIIKTNAIHTCLAILPHNSVLYFQQIDASMFHPRLSLF